MEYRTIMAIILVAFIVGPVSSEVKNFVFPSGYRNCGRQLAAALSIVCNKKINPVFEESQKIRREAHWIPYRKETEAIASIGGYVRRRRHIVDECCEKVCTTSQMSKYCW